MNLEPGEEVLFVVGRFSVIRLVDEVSSDDHDPPNWEEVVEQEPDPDREEAADQKLDPIREEAANEDPDPEESDPFSMEFITSGNGGIKFPMNMTENSVDMAADDEDGSVQPSVTDTKQLAAM